MAYMGPRFMGGGQIYSSNNQPPFQQLQQQIQVMQMHMRAQLQQKQQPEQGPKQQPQQQSQKRPQTQQNPGNAINKNNDKHVGPTKATSGPTEKNSEPNSKPVNKTQGPQGTPFNKNAQAKEKREILPVKVKKESEQSLANPPASHNNGNLQNAAKGTKPQSLMGQPPPLMGNTPDGASRDARPSPIKNQPPSHSERLPNNSNSGYNSNYSNNPGRPGPPPDQKKSQMNAGHYEDRKNYYDNSNNYHNRNANRPIPSMNNTNRNMSEGYNYHNQGNRGGKGPKPFYGHDRIKEKLRQTLSEPQLDLPPLDNSEKKFNALSRLFIGNLPKSTSQDELQEMFGKYGEIGQIYVNSDASFAFINFDYKVNATKAMQEMDNQQLKTRFIKVRFASLNEGIRIKNLSPYVSNELLEKCFSVFGQVDSCRIVVDGRGMSKGEGIIIFKDKKTAVMAVKKCQEECFYLSGALRPAVVNHLEETEDNEEGLPESTLPRNDEYHQERSIAPHFADDGTFEFDFGLQWKQIFHVYDEKKLVLERDFKMEIERLEKKMVLARVEYETDKLRKELAAREAESAQLRRHFVDDDQSAPQYPGHGGPSGSFDSFSSSKRPLEQPPYDVPYNAPYDTQYGSEYDRGAYRGDYDSRNYDRSYDRGYGGYNRPGFNEQAELPPPSEPTATPFDQPPPADRQERPYDRPPPQPQDNFKAASKRPRY